MTPGIDSILDFNLGHCPVREMIKSFEYQVAGLCQNIAIPEDTLSGICGGIIYKSSINSGLPKSLEMLVC